MLILSPALVDQLFAAMDAAHPLECCGLIEGVRDGEAVRALALHPSANLAPDPATAFIIDPALQFSLARGLRGSGRSIIGCYHSHPAGKAVPSPRDRANGCEDGFVWVILATGVMNALAAYHGPAFAPLAIVTQ